MANGSRINNAIHLEMKICICYVAVTLGPITADYASRFVATFNEYPPGADADLMVICNGGPLSTELAMIFAPLNPLFYPRANDPGRDVSAYQDAARGPCADYDAMLCLGESNYFHRSGWLKRLVGAWEQHGSGMYGPFSSNLVRSHLNTTAFFTIPKLIAAYPYLAVDRKTRYEFEHGANSLWRRAQARGLPVRMVTWDGEWEPRSWRNPKNILWRGDQSNCLMWCSHTDNWHHETPKRKVQWSRLIDIPYK
jgi:hypothetical protein